MSFSIPESKKSLKQNRFEFEHEGKKYDIPKLKFAPAGAMEHMEQGRDLSGLIMAADTEAARNVIRSLDGDQLDAFMGAWAEDSGVTPGESGASTES